MYQDVTVSLDMASIICEVNSEILSFKPDLEFILQHGYTPYRLAKEIGITPQAVHYWVKYDREPTSRAFLSIRKIANQMREQTQVRV